MDFMRTLLKKKSVKITDKKKLIKKFETIFALNDTPKELKVREQVKQKLDFQRTQSNQLKRRKIVVLPKRKSIKARRPLKLHSRCESQQLMLRENTLEDTIDFRRQSKGEF